MRHNSSISKDNPFYLFPVTESQLRRSTAVYVGERKSDNKPKNTRIESDSVGEIEVPADRYWGAEIQRSLTHFAIGDDLIPKEIIKALAMIKKAAAITDSDLGGC